MDSRTTRRVFMRAALAAGVAPAIIPAGAVRAQGGKPPPSGRLNLGIIGYGTMGSDHIGNFLQNEKVRVAAICDPIASTTGYGYQAERTCGREPGVQRVNDHYKNSDCKGFADFREMLDLPGLDAVLVTSPDHWHATHAIYAARKKLHIYCQKALTYTIGQGLALVREVAKAGVTFQTGSQQRSDNYFRMACEFVRNGYIGKLQKIEVRLPPHEPWGKKGDDLLETPLPVPACYGDSGFDLWLGPAPKRPYIPKIHRPLIWRWNLDYSSGAVTDWGAHHFDIVQWALDTDATGPVAIENIKCVLPDRNLLWNALHDYSFEFVYADGTRVSVMGNVPMGNTGITFYGEGGKKIFVTRGKLETTPDDLIRTKLTDKDVHLYVSGQHERNFVECCFSGKETITPCVVGHRSNTIGLLASTAMRLGLGRIGWDPKAEVFTGPKAEEANALAQIGPGGPALHNGWKI